MSLRSNEAFLFKALNVSKVFWFNRQKQDLNKFIENEVYSPLTPLVEDPIPLRAVHFVTLQLMEAVTSALFQL